MARFLIGLLVAALLGGCVIFPDDDWGHGHHRHHSSGWHGHHYGSRGWGGHR